MDLIRFWEQDFLRQKWKAFSYEIDRFIEESICFLEKKYPKYEKFKLISEFIDIHLSDWVMANFTTLERLGYYWITEVEMELDNAIKHALTWSYKSTFSDLRRALEMMITQVYFSLESIPKKEAYLWYKSINDTPYMKSMLQSLMKDNSRFSLFEKEFQWVSKIKELYWRLSDYSHNKWVKNGYRELNGSHIFLWRTHLNEIKLDTLSNCIDLYIDTAVQILLVLILYNPVLIKWVPIDEKFWFNWPMSWFYTDHQSEILRSLIPDSYINFFIDVLESDKDLSGLIKSIENMPDITEEQIKIQITQNWLEK